jgi:hypothetical protein
MTYRIRTAVAVTDAGAELIRKAMKFLRDHYPKYALVWLTSVSGELGTHVWVSDYPSMAAMEEYDAKLNADPGWIKLMKEAGPGPFWSSIRDDIYNKVRE